MLPRHPDKYPGTELRDWVWRLIAERTEEGPRLDYKELQGLDSPSQKREVARDASSFLNTYGGTILYGVPEARNADGRPIPVAPYGMNPVNSFGSRVENILLDSVHPAIPESRIKEIPAPGDAGKVVYLLWLPESHVGVHMVESYGDFRFWRRGQYRAVEMTERDVEERYRQLALVRGWSESLPDSREMTYLSEWMPTGHRSRYTISPIRPLTDHFDIGSLDFRQWILEHGYPGLPDFSPSPDGVRTKVDRKDIERNDIGITEIFSHGAICHWSSTVVRENTAAWADDELKGLLLLAAGDELMWFLEFLRYASSFYASIGYVGPLRITFRISNASGDVSRTLGIKLRGPTRFAATIAPNREIRLVADSSALDLSNSPVNTLREIAQQLYRCFGHWEVDCISNDGQIIRDR